MKIGVSTACLYPMRTEKALTKFIESGIDLFEIFYNTQSEIEPPFTEKLNSILKSSKSTLKSVHPFTSGYEPYLIFTDYERRYLDSLEFYKRYFDAASKLGAEILVIHGDRKTPEIGGISDEEYFDKFAELSLVGEKFGITVAQENVNMFRSQRIDFITKMKNYLGTRANFVFDLKQAIRSGNTVEDVCKAMGENIVHVHMNDHDETKDCLLPGLGSTDYEELFRILKNNNYKGDAVIEVYSENFGPVEEIAKSKQFLDEISKKI